MRYILENSSSSTLETTADKCHLSVDEEYIPDERANLRPSEVVQSKLIGMLSRGMAIPVSCMHHRRLVRR